jgi:hypothetical protein
LISEAKQYLAWLVLGWVLKGIHYPLYICVKHLRTSHKKNLHSVRAKDETTKGNPLHLNIAPTQMFAKSFIPVE